MESKLEMKSKNIVNYNIEQLGKIFPNCIKEGKIDFETLKQELTNEIIDDRKEKYQLTWSGKKESIILANTPTTNTLRPYKSESINFDTTKNIYIESDNLEALKLLQNSYINKIKCIYIDPPYNRGSDLIYKDKYYGSEENELDKSGMIDEMNNKLTTNLDSNGRFHSDWLSMMYSRIKLSRNLLSKDGMIFVSISDVEAFNLRKIMDEIFGETNFLADVIWNSTKSVTNTAIISVSHTHNLIYFKDMDYFVNNRTEFRLPDNGEGFSNPDNDPRGAWKADPFQVGGWRPNQQYEIINPNTGEKYLPNANCSWKNDYEHYLELVKDNRIVFGKNGTSGPQRKRFIWEAEERGKVAKTIWDDIETTTNGTQRLKKLFDNNVVFDNPKPVELVKRVLQLNYGNDFTVLDFFSGSATTAEAVMTLNAEDNGKRKYIAIQLPENLDECLKKATNDSKGTLQTAISFLDSINKPRILSEIGKERIRRAGEELRKKYGENFDYGFRVYKLDESNMKDIYYAPSDLIQSQLNMFESNIKEDRTSEDLLTQVILDLGLTLDLKIEERKILSNNVYYVEDNSLVACFDNTIDINIIDEICKCNPLKIVFKESSFKSDSDKINTFERIKKLSNDTEINII